MVTFTVEEHHQRLTLSLLPAEGSAPYALVAQAGPAGVLIGVVTPADAPPITLPPLVLPAAAAALGIQTQHDGRHLRLVLVNPEPGVRLREARGRPGSVTVYVG